MNKLLITGIIVLSTIISETLAQFFLEKSVSLSQSPTQDTFIVMGLITYAIVGGLFRQLLIYVPKWAVAVGIWNAGTTICVAAISYFIFNQTLNNKEIIALIMAIAATLLMIHS